MMAQEASTEASVVTSYSVPSWLDVQMGSVVSTGGAAWSHHMHPWHASHHPNSNSSCEEDISISATSFTNASNHSGLSADSGAATDLSGEPVENHLWSQVLLGVGNVGELRDTHNEVRENFLEVLSSKNLPTDMSEPACNYLKKLESNWGFTNNLNPSSLNNLEKHVCAYNGVFTEHEKPSNLSDLLNNWSIAPPAPVQLGSPCSSSVGAPMPRYMEPDFALFANKHESSSTSPPYAGTGAGDGGSGGGPPCYGHQMKRDKLHQEFGVNSEASSLLMRRPARNHAVGHSNSAIVGGSNKYFSGGTVPDAPWSATTKNFSDLVTFGGSLNKPLMDFRGSKSSMRSSDSAAADGRKQGREVSPPIRSGGGNHPSITSEGKKKRSENGAETHLKKTKHESSATPSAKLQVPKVKLGEKITALQQIVSPFGKTDTASVLMETINYITFLHEQVQLLSNPYMKTGANKDLNSWGGMEWKDKRDAKAELRSRGLCLVPISCTPQIYRENNGPDYWTPPYRGCLYR